MLPADLAELSTAEDFDGTAVSMLLGHLHKLARASNVMAVVDAAAVPYLEDARKALADGFVSGGTRRNLDWVRPHLSTSVGEDELLLLADAQTSGSAIGRSSTPAVSTRSPRSSPWLSPLERRACSSWCTWRSDLAC